MHNCYDIQTGILNPDINALLGRVRHTNLLVTADRGLRTLADGAFETIDTLAWG